MGCVNSDINSEQRPFSESIFDDMEHKDRLKEKFGYAYEYRIGPFFNKSGLRSKKNQSNYRENNNNNISSLDNKCLSQCDIGSSFKENKIDSYSDVEAQTIQDWRQLAKDSKKKQHQNQENQIEVNVAIDKIDKMLLNIQDQNAEELKKKIKQGPPKCLRWSSWKTSVQWNEVYESGMYEKLIDTIDQRKDQEFIIQIEKDITRTFPKQYYFSHEKIKGKSLGHNQLMRVLGAISLYFPQLGYCQGMNFILGFLIMISGGNEIDVFWTFVSLVKNKNFLIIGLYEHGMPLLKFMEFITFKKMQKYLGDYYEKFIDLEIPNSMWLTKWYMTLFLYQFPTSLCLRIWDYYMAEGIFGMVGVAISMIKLFQSKLQNLDQVETMIFFQDLTNKEKELTQKNSEFYIDADLLIQEASQIQISRSDIEKYAKQYIKQNKNIKDKKEKQDINNDYVELFKYYNNQKQFNLKVDQFVDPKKITYEELEISRSCHLTNIEEERTSQYTSLTQSQKTSIIQKNNDNNKEKQSQKLLIQQIQVELPIEVKQQKQQYTDIQESDQVISGELVLQEQTNNTENYNISQLDLDILEEDVQYPNSNQDNQTEQVQQNIFIIGEQ